MNIEKELAALHSALDDVLDLERGLATPRCPARTLSWWPGSTTR